MLVLSQADAGIGRDAATDRKQWCRIASSVFPVKHLLNSTQQEQLI